MRQKLEKEWCKTYFHNQFIEAHEARREIDVASSTQKANAAGKMYMRIKRYLIEEDRVNLANEHGMIETKANESKKWIKAMGSIRFIPWIVNNYDFGIQGMKIIYSNSLKILKVTLHVKCKDEGFEGGLNCIDYENERIREERKIQKLKNKN